MAGMTALARMMGLSPFGPIFGKELRVTARRKRSYVLRVVYLGFLLLVLFAAWTASRAMHYSGGVAAQVQAQSQLGIAFYLCFLWFTVISMAAIGPVLTATAVSAERLGRTLDVLLMTPITAWQIVSGKLLSRLLVALTLIGLSLPVLALTRLLGGVELWQMAGAVCLATVVALHTAAIGLFFSTFMKRAFAVILLSYATTLFLQAFVPFVCVVGLDIGDGPGEERMWANVNWPLAATMLSEPRFARGGAMAWVTCCIVYLCFTALLLVISAIVLRKISRRSGHQAAAVNPAEYIPIVGLAPPPPLPAVPGEQAAPPPPPLPTVLPYSPPQTKTARPTKLREVSDNPILWRETRRPLTTRRWQAILFGTLGGVLLLISYGVLGSENVLDDHEVQMGYACIFHGLMWLLVSVVSATAIAQEKEADTWTLLLATPVSGATIVFGKATGLLRRMMWPFLFVVGHFLLFTVTGVISFDTLLLIVWVLFSFNAIWLATGVYLSLRLRTVTFAVILNLLLAILIYPVVGVLLMIGGQLSDHRSQHVAQVAWYFPYTYLVVGIHELNRDYGRWYFSPDDDRFWLPPKPWEAGRGDDISVTRAEYLGVVFLIGSIHIGAAALILAGTARRFDRIVGRAPQLHSQQALPERHPASEGLAAAT